MYLGFFMILHFIIEKEKSNEVKLRIEEDINKGIKPELAVLNGVKYMQKMVDKGVEKHKKLLMKQFEYKLIKDYLIDQIHTKDKMELYYGKLHSVDIDSDNTHSTSNNKSN